MNEADLRTALRWTLVALAVGFLVLAGTGLYLIWNYNPAAHPAWLAGRVRTAHQVTSRVTIVIVLALTAETVMLVVKTRRWAAPVLGVGTMVTWFAAIFTGYLLPWDQLALWTITVGTDLRGYRPIVSDRVQYVLIDSHTISGGEFRGWFWAHTVAVPVLLVALVLALVLASLRHQKASTP